MKMHVLSGLLTCSTGRVRTEEVSLCSALFQSGQSGWFCKQANNLSYYRTLPALLFLPPSSLLNMFLHGTLHPFLCTNGAACFCYVETCEQLNLMATFLEVCLNRLPKQVLHPGSRKPPAFFSDPTFPCLTFASDCLS